MSSTHPAHLSGLSTPTDPQGTRVPPVTPAESRAAWFGTAAAILTGAHGWPWPDEDEAFWQARAAAHEARKALEQERQE